MEELYMTRLTWLLSSILAEFQQLNTDLLGLLYKLGALITEKKKTDFLRLHWRAYFRKDKFGDFVSGGEKKGSPLSSLKLHHFLKSWKTRCDQVFPTLKSWTLIGADCQGEFLWSTMTLFTYSIRSNQTVHERMPVKKKKPKKTLFLFYFIAKYATF